MLVVMFLMMMRLVVLHRSILNNKDNTTEHQQPVVLHRSILNNEDNTTEHQQADHPIPAPPTHHQNILTTQPYQDC
jgi:hypothetical protein